MLLLSSMLSACGGSAVIGGEHEMSSDVLTALGKDLFFDTLLSLDQTVSCATCHKPEHGFADDVALSVGVSGVPLRRHTPHLFNLAGGSSFFWDGRARSLEEQALMPIQNADEMGLELSVLIERLEAHPEYPGDFFRTYGSPGITKKRLAIAIAAFERTLIADGTPYDRFTDGDGSAMTDSAKRGMEAFFRHDVGCARCHSGPNFTDGDFHNTGLFGDDQGRAAIDRVGNFRMRPYPFFHTQKAFKTPGLRNVALTSPYMHNGVFETLEEVVQNYNRGSQDPESYGISLDIKPLGLTDQEVTELVDFLEALSSPRRWDDSLGLMLDDEVRHVFLK